MQITDFLPKKEENKEEKLKKLEVFCKDYLKDDPLWKNAHNLVFGEGNINAKIVIIGEAPGENEDLQGRPFVGKAGKLLRETLSKYGLLDKVYITNVVKLRPPQNRNPTIEEIERHKPCLMKQLSIIKPDIIVTLGNFSTKLLLADFDTKKMKKIPGISKVKNQVFEKEIFGRKVKIIPIYHPAAVLYNPNLKEEFENGFKLLLDLIQKKE